MPARARALKLALLVLLALGVPASAAGAWSAPVRIAGPVAADLLPAVIAAPGQSSTEALGLAVNFEDDPASSQAFLSLRRAGGGFGAPLVLPGAQQTLALAYRGRDLIALAGASEPGLACCSLVQAVGPVRGNSPGPSRTLLGGLAGATTARLLALPRRLLAVVATERGVWAAQSPPGSDRFGAARLLSGLRQLPQAMDAVALPSGQTAVAWAARQDAVTAPGPRTLYLARGSLRGAPGRGRALLSVAPGHAIDELGLAAGAGVPTVAWIESWYDRGGSFHAQVKVADLTPKLRPRAVSPARELAAGLAFAGNGAGAQVLSWKGCNSAGGCRMRVLLRRRGAVFGSLRRPGRIDPSETPAVAIATDGHAAVGWIRDGAVVAATTSGRRLGAPRLVARTAYATDLTLAATRRGALAAWTQGTLAQSVLGASLPHL
ncbi:MAG: hypothetical protein M3Z27_02780 [Actinomycetota bacterium]|nr:hypothetical protein [Actinomycetota bacterium]